MRQPSALFTLSALSEYAGDVRTVRRRLRKPSGVVEKKIGLYVHRVALEADTPVTIKDCAQYARRLYIHWSNIDGNCRDTRQKGAKDLAEWMPENLDFQFEYAQLWVGVKVDWELSADAAKFTALTEISGDDPLLDELAIAPEVMCAP
jgi:hypothetical protein